MQCRQRLSRRLVRDLRLGRYVRQYQGAAGGFLGAGDPRGEIRARMGRAVGMGADCGAAGVRALPPEVDRRVAVCRDGVLRHILLSVPRELRDLLHERQQCRDLRIIRTDRDRGARQDVHERPVAFRGASDRFDGRHRRSRAGEHERCRQSSPASVGRSDGARGDGVVGLLFDSDRQGEREGLSAGICHPQGVRLVARDDDAVLHMGRDGLRILRARRLVLSDA